jgi:recombinational DNA repair protein (RecF pathway)
MSHHIHTTEAVVIDVLPQDVHASFLLYTKEYGLLYAQATGVRKPLSKLRYSLSLYSIVQVSLVKGKHVWRIVGASSIQNMYFATDNKDASRMVARLTSTIRRLVHGETQDASLYTTLVSGLHALIGCDEKRVVCIEILSLVRMLYHLGYVSVDALIEPLCKDDTFNTELYDYVHKHKTACIEVINKGLKESQL